MNRWMDFFAASKSNPGLSKDEFMGKLNNLTALINNRVLAVEKEIVHVFDHVPEWSVFHIGLTGSKSILAMDFVSPFNFVLFLFIHSLFFYLRLLVFFEFKGLVISLAYFYAVLVALFVVLSFRRVLLIESGFLTRLKNKKLLVKDLSRLKKLDEQLEFRHVQHPALKAMLQENIFKSVTRLLVKNFSSNDSLASIPDIIKKRSNNEISAIFKEIKDAEAIFQRRDDQYIQNGDDIDSLIISYSYEFKI